MILLVSQIKAARALIGWSQDDLSERSGVSVPTIKRIEASGAEQRGNAKNYHKIQKALEASGVEFIPENGGGAGVRLKKKA